MKRIRVGGGAVLLANSGLSPGPNMGQSRLHLSPRYDVSNHANSAARIES